MVGGTVQAVEDAVDNFTKNLNGDYLEAGENEAFEQHIFDETGKPAHDIPNFNTEAAQNVAVAFGNPAAYHARATNAVMPKDGDFVSVESFSSGVAGTVPTFSKPVTSMESYDQSALNNFRSMSVAFNGGGARQNAFGELFWTTTVIGADQTGVEISIRPTMIMRDVRHGETGDPMSFNRVRLLDAVRDHELLASKVTDLIPHITPDNEDKFYTADGVSLPDAKIEDHDIPTGFIKTGIEVDLISLSNHPGLLDNGIMDKTDAIDPPLMVGKVLVKVTNALGDTTEYFVVNTKMHHGNTFQVGTEGKAREQLLNFRFNSMNFDPGTKTIDGSASTLFADAFNNNWSIGVKGSISGLTDLERGNVETNPGTMSIAKLVGESGEVGITSGAGKAFVDSIGNMEVVAWYPAGNRSNLNLRQRGTLLTYVEEKYRYSVPLQAPIAIVKPTSYNSGDAQDLKSLTEAIRVRNSNNAVTSLFNYADHLNQVVNVQKDLGNLYGIGGKVIEPYYKEFEMDLTDITTSMQSSTRQLDISSVLLDRIDDEVHAALAESNYMAVLEHTDLNGNVKPVVAVGTDIQTQRHLTVSGDLRVNQLGLEKRIAATNDKRMRWEEGGDDYGYIFVTFKRPGVAPNGLDPADFGRMLWVPELVTTVPTITRNGSTSKELIVQPRVAHIPTLPILIKIKVKNLRKALTAAHNPYTP